MARIEWSVTAASSATVRYCLLALVAAAGGFGTLAVGAGAFAVAGLVASGDYAMLGLLAVLALVGGPMSLLYLLPMLTDESQRPPGLRDNLTGLGLATTAKAAVAGGVGTVVLVAVAVVADRSWLVVVPFAGFFAGVFLIAPLVSILAGEGAVDADAGTLTYETRTADLAALRGLRRWTTGGVTAFWLSYAHGAGSVPRLVVVPAGVAGDVHAALAAAVRTDASEATTRERDRTVTVAAGLTAACFVGLGGVFAVVSDLPLSTTLWLNAVLLVFAALFAWVGYQYW